MSYATTVAGWVTILGVFYVIYKASTPKSKKRNVAAQSKASKTSTVPEPRKEDRKKKQRLQSFASEPKAKTTSQSTERGPFLALQTDNGAADGVDNKEFAKQLAKAQEGTKFAAKADSGKQKEKPVKQSRANKIGSNGNQEEAPIAAPASTLGAEADDDKSSAASPAAEPADTTGVADMLEPVPSGPSILRLTDTTSKTKPQKAAKAPEQVETKKQRQNRKKAEAAKAAREDAEKERKTLEEKQRRQARIAEGRAAKDGSQFTAAAVKNSAWNQGTPNGSATKTETNGTGQLLDTFEPELSSLPKLPASKPDQPQKSESSWISSLPSEEQQIEMLKDETEEWSTVKTKASKKSAKKEPAVESIDETPAPTRPAASVKPLVAPVNSSKPSQSFGSFSALTSKNEPVEDAEEEWDV